MKHDFLKIILITFFFIGFYFFVKKRNSPLDKVSLKNWETTSNTFRENQLRFERVRTAYALKEDKVKKMLALHGIHSFDIDIFLRAFKTEGTLEVWAKPIAEQSYQLIWSYDFCANSGTVGPKRKEGDRQIPEGFYEISNFNPKSQFLLSLKINYPNASDKILSDPVKPGSDIYIHGNCQTIGCIPITDSFIQELYVLAVEGRKNNNTIPIHIFPSKKFEIKENELEGLKVFWGNLREGFEYFEKNKTLPTVKVAEDGKYILVL